MEKTRGGVRPPQEGVSDYETSSQILDSLWGGFGTLAVFKCSFIVTLATQASRRARHETSISLDNQFDRTIYLPPAKGGKISTRTGAVSCLSRSAG